MRRLLYPEIKILVTGIDPIHLKNEKEKNTFDVQACGMAFFFKFSPEASSHGNDAAHHPRTRFYAQGGGEIKRER